MAKKTSIVRVSDLFRIEISGYAEDLSDNLGFKVSVSDASFRLADVLRKMRKNMNRKLKA